MRPWSLVSTGWAIALSLFRLPVVAARLHGSLRRLNKARSRAMEVFKNELERAGLPSNDAEALAREFPEFDWKQFAGNRWQVGRRLTSAGSRNSPQA